MDTNKELDIEHIVFIGRTYKEYMKLFDLEHALPKAGRILDCAAGPSSFTAEASAKGIDVSACDAMYNTEPFALFQKGNMDIAHVFKKFNAVSENYTWKFYKDRDDVISYRKMALGRFAKDFARNKYNKRYQHAELPALPYPDNAFDLILSSHFLFLYGDRLDIDFHIECLKELTRVSCGEVRIYPLCGLDAEPYNQMDNILSYLRKMNIRHEIKKVPFEFQRGSDKMMVLYK